MRVLCESGEAAVDAPVHGALRASLPHLHLGGAVARRSRVQGWRIVSLLVQIMVTTDKMANWAGGRALLPILKSTKFPRNNYIL